MSNVQFPVNIKRIIYKWFYIALNISPPKVAPILYKGNFTQGCFFQDQLSEYSYGDDGDFFNTQLGWQYTWLIKQYFRINEDVL